MRTKLVLGVMAVLVCVIVLLETQIGVSQQPGGKKGKGGFGDPGERFDGMDKDKKGYINISDIPWGKEAAELYAKDKGITNGQLTREQYIAYSAVAREYFGKLGPDAFKKGKGNKGGGTDQKGANTTPEAPKGPKVTVGDASDVDRIAEEQFRKFDTNGDGFLNEEEIMKNTKKLREDWKKWDENKDSLISLGEYKKILQRNHQEAQRGS